MVQLIDGNGKITKIYEYDSFGNYYQPERGRFLTRDTYTGEEDEPESLHLYTYCYNNPVTFSDI